MTEIIDGKKIMMAGGERIIAPLTLKHVRDLRPRLVEINGIAGVPTDQQVDAIRDIVMASLSRNYPGITPEEVEGLLDMGNVAATLEAVMGISGLDNKPGEAQAGS